MFKDSPEDEQLFETVSGWHLPDVTDDLQRRFLPDHKLEFREISSFFRQRLASAGSQTARKKEEKAIVKWLYSFVRLNVKRGRIFDLCEVLRTRDADCLGYTKLFVTLGRGCGLDTGAVEVVTDTRGLNVPHTASLIRLADGRKQFADLWYGSPDIRHKRLGVQVNRNDGWHTEDIDFSQINKADDVTFLTDQQVDAVTLYIEGNRSLQKENYQLAIEQYSEAARLYPHNNRVYFNRAVACEKLGLRAQAEADYAKALGDTNSLKRTLAAQPVDVVDLILLDQIFIPELDQEIYLLNQGFITGRKVSPEKIAAKLVLSLEEVEAVLSLIRSLLNR
jgi:tetratricopeptide (TPR) repeat protein